MRTLTSILALLITASSLSHAQSNEVGLKTRLIHNVFFLRGLWKNDKLQFDSAGQLVGKSPVTIPMLAMVSIESVKLKHDRLVLEGARLQAYFLDGELKSAPLHHGIHIEIAAPPSNDYAGPLKAVFAASIPEFTPALTAFWQNCLLSNGASPNPPASVAALPPTPRKIGGSVKAPIVLYQTQASFEDVKTPTPFHESVTVNLQVNACGNPTNVRVDNGIGYGLDERATDAVRHFLFQPAMLAGQPVPVEMDIQISFQRR